MIWNIYVYVLSIFWTLIQSELRIIILSNSNVSSLLVWNKLDFPTPPWHNSPWMNAQTCPISHELTMKMVLFVTIEPNKAQWVYDWKQTSYKVWMVAIKSAQDTVDYNWKQIVPFIHRLATIGIRLSSYDIPHKINELLLEVKGYMFEWPRYKHVGDSMIKIGCRNTKSLLKRLRDCKI